MGILFLVRHAQAAFLEQNYDKLSALGEAHACHLGDYWARRQIIFKNDLASSPIIAEMTCMRLSESRQLVVVLLKERSLRMTDEKENSHCNPALPSNVIPQDVQWRM